MIQSKKAKIGKQRKMKFGRIDFRSHLRVQLETYEYLKSSSALMMSKSCIKENGLMLNLGHLSCS
jgi:hypothetical protein